MLIHLLIISQTKIISLTKRPVIIVLFIVTLLFFLSVNTKNVPPVFAFLHKFFATLLRKNL